MIELTAEQQQAVDAAIDPIVIDPRTKQTYRIIREEVYKLVQDLMYDDSPWTSEEKALLASRAFGKGDDTDYSEYLEEPK